MLKNGKSVGIDEITGEMTKNVDESMTDWIWKLCKSVCGLYSSERLEESCNSTLIEG